MLPFNLQAGSKQGTVAGASAVYTHRRIRRVGSKWGEKNIPRGVGWNLADVVGWRFEQTGEKPRALDPVDIDVGPTS